VTDYLFEKQQICILDQILVCHASKKNVVLTHEYKHLPLRTVFMYFSNTDSENKQRKFIDKFNHRITT
jgi:hypothetical protein